MKKDNEMRPRTSHVVALKILAALLPAAIFMVPAVVSNSTAQANENPAQSTQKAFETPEKAAQSLILATEAYDVSTLMELFGPDGKDLFASSDPVEDKNHATAFTRLAREKYSVTLDPKNAGRATILVGNEDWPLPVPIVKRKGKWYFDSKTGRTEILFRRIGSNELDAIQICRGFVEAQLEYALERHDDSGVNQYAQRVVSTDDKHDGLAWKNPDGSWGGPVGEQIAKAIEQGYSEQGQPFHGYYFKVLKGQGPSAPLGQMDFLVSGAMIGGFALAAAPAQYRVTGVKTFIVSHDGIVYERDLGPDSLTLFKAMDRYNPDKSWHPTNDEP